MQDESGEGHDVTGTFFCHNVIYERTLSPHRHTLSSAAAHADIVLYIS